jgi:HPr kinase/phosphorylase
MENKLTELYRKKRFKNIEQHNEYSPESSEMHEGIACAQIFSAALSHIDFLYFTEYIRRTYASHNVAYTRATEIIHKNSAPEIFLQLAKQYEVPLLKSNETTSEIMSTIISYLGVELAERISRHGVLVEVYGEGILIVGDSAVGKSETAVELIKRGHRLIADDEVEIKRVSSKSLVGSAPDNSRHFVALRGPGIVDARNIFGIGAVKLTEKIDMVIQLEQWDTNKSYDTLGTEDVYATILGIKVPATVVPVKPGRNLSIIIEIAAMNHRQKKMGYNAAKEFLQRVGMEDFDLPPTELELWF